ncbi:MAG TPA: BtaA family protein [Rudaea sp.]|jgi:S-adenosylmethionine-diacylglycerol 3-amino-3-carboxypropyl transferase|nr:BtaA family protein [Rudaea sp.]
MSTFRDRIDHYVFNAIYSRSLVYNACWEDPAVDRQVLGISDDDTVLAITSAGCNVLDYALLKPRRIYAVDANPRQTALLELKLSGIKNLEFDDFFAIFGEGYHADFQNLYTRHLRADLSDFAKSWWDKHGNWFTSKRGSFYFHGLSGLVASGVRHYFRMRPRLRHAMDELIGARDLPEQQAIYDQRIAPLLWTRVVNWTISRQFVMSLLGVPYPQRKLVEAQHSNGIASFIRGCVEYVFRQLPLGSNYFWRLYLTGRYDRECCPEYLKESGFHALKNGLADRISAHTTTVTQFLENHREPISRFVLLDHMDWMSSYYPEALVEEWNAICERAAPGARILLRSAHAKPAYLEEIKVGPDRRHLRDLFTFLDAEAHALQTQDRVHTYPGFVIAHAPA